MREVRLAFLLCSWSSQLEYKHLTTHWWTMDDLVLGQLLIVYCAGLWWANYLQVPRIHQSGAPLLDWGSALDHWLCPSFALPCSCCEMEEHPWASNTRLCPRPTNLLPCRSPPLWESQEQSRPEYQRLNEQPGCGGELELHQNQQSWGIRSRQVKGFPIWGHGAWCCYHGDTLVHVSAIRCKT